MIVGVLIEPNIVACIFTLARIDRWNTVHRRCWCQLKASVTVNKQPRRNQARRVGRRVSHPVGACRATLGNAR